MTEIYKNFLELFFPNPCFGCGKKLGSNEKYICTSCLIDLPYTKEYLSLSDSEGQKLFWGKVDIQQVYTGFIFSKEGITQKLVHELKYKGQPHLGVLMGKMLGKEILKYNLPLPDLIVPVPLHKKRLRKRGYNQAEKLGEGISKTLNIPQEKQILSRVYHNDSQTKKERFTRWDNVSEIFMVKQPDVIHNKHILIVDDVITTGATLEALCRAIKDTTNCTVSIATFAITKSN